MDLGNCIASYRLLGRIWSCWAMRIKSMRSSLFAVLTLIENWKMGKIWRMRECKTFRESGLTTLIQFSICTNLCHLTDFHFYLPSTYLQALFPQYSPSFLPFLLSSWFPFGRWSPYTFKSLFLFIFEQGILTTHVHCWTEFGPAQSFGGGTTHPRKSETSENGFSHKNFAFWVEKMKKKTY